MAETQVDLTKNPNQVALGDSVLTPEERIRFSQEPPYELQVGAWAPNVGMIGGGLTFTNSRTKTSYERFNGSFIHPTTGKPVNCVLNINQINITNQVVEPSLLVGETIYMPRIEFEIALRRQRPNAPSVVIAITNFFYNPSEEVKKVKLSVKTDLLKDAAERQQKIATDAKAKFQKGLMTGMIKSPLDAAMIANPITSTLNAPQQGNNPNDLQGQTVRGTGDLGTGTAQSKNPPAEVMEQVTAGGDTVAQNDPNAQGGPANDRNANSAEENLG